MNNKYFMYAVCVTLLTTVISWASMLGSSSNSGSRGGSSWSSGSGSYGGSSGGGHK